MPSDAVGRCYCGAHYVRATGFHTATYCHCSDGRRLTGAPVAAFGAYAKVEITPPVEPKSFSGGSVTRWACPECGSALAATFDYLPDHTYVPLGTLDDPPAPQLHSHAGSAVPWLHIDDDLPREDGSARETLR